MRYEIYLQKSGHPRQTLATFDKAEEVMAYMNVQFWLGETRGDYSSGENVRFLRNWIDRTITFHYTGDSSPIMWTPSDFEFRTYFLNTVGIKYTPPKEQLKSKYTEDLTRLQKEMQQVQALLGIEEE